VLPNLITYNAAISACEKGRQPQQALKLLQEMHLRGLEPDLITCNALVRTYEGVNEAQQAAEALIQRQGLVPNDITYTALISTSEIGKSTELA